MTLPPTSPPRAVHLRAEHHPDCLGIGEPSPRLSWRTETDTPAWVQAAFQLQSLNTSGQVLEETPRTERAESVLVAWPFAPLVSREQRRLRVRVWGQDGSASAWSELLSVEAGLHTPGDWQARFITPDWTEDLTRPQPAPLLRTTFSVRPGLVSARLYVSALGVYEARLNGARVGDQLLSPGWTSYHHRLRYQTFDVTEQLLEGENALGAMLGDGWYRGRLGFGGGRRNLYGERLALLAQLELTYDDGTLERTVTDDRWRASTGAIRASDLYDGETYDARLEQPGWDTRGFDDRHWTGVRTLDHDLSTLVAPDGPPVRRIQTLAALSVHTSPSGRTLVDFGQNLVGWVRLRVSGEAGQTVTLRHAEVLEDGELGTRPLRFAACTDQYTLKGGGEELWEPRFTFHGFRYVQVDGWPGSFDPAALEAVVVHSDLERRGWFECSEPLVERLHENIVWGMRGNFLDLPTDCPQRDERLGWTGDIGVFAPTAAFLYDTAGFLRSWLADLAADQLPDGGVPCVVPQVLETPIVAAAWGDAATFVPWALYQRYGDPDILAAQFSSMQRWVDYVAGRAGPSLLWTQDFQFGDWLDPAAPPDNAAAGRTQPGVVATAYFARSAELLGLSADILGRAEERGTYLNLASDIRAAFNREYVTPSGQIISDSATAYALGLEFGLLGTEGQRQKSGERLKMLLRENGDHISTGFVGTPLICDALCAVGAVREAYLLLTQEECPSWLYPVTMGATTVWERWDSMLPDGSINPGEMTSFNHYALGAVADWLHRRVAGLAPAEPGYRRLEIRPLPGGPLTHASARHVTPYGEASSGWRTENGEFVLDVQVPPNTSARVTLPTTGEVFEVGSGVHVWRRPQASVAPAPPITLDSTYDDLRLQPQVYRTVLDVVEAHSAEHVQAFRRAFQSASGTMNLRRALFGVPLRDKLARTLETVLGDQPKVRVLLEDRG
ncbi:glycoside hydrolase family 78 protein [Deinococcus ruber]|uniref:alpha-L-rhamnosidase n=1 Tax=Deinococcus ruber TaxID=1848197 RepID=A0A918CLD2_9DEIO|nr:glycoside hydrolase family 78 protein [Deinococcus ruber]GGR28976.1 alpha-L-rhamnosidase [Deinococcus ruber]